MRRGNDEIFSFKLPLKVFGSTFKVQGSKSERAELEPWNIEL
jgi:hypothetical protein